MAAAPIHLNVGGTLYSTTRAILTKDARSLLADWFADPSVCPLPRDPDGRFFIDRDGQLFRFLLDFLRNDRLVLPERFAERARLRHEASYFKVGRLVGQLNDVRQAYITIGYQGSFSFGRQGLAADVNFRKISRILICGRVNVCREVFGEALNEDRDPDRGQDDRYTARFFLKHTFLEQAFDSLALCGFRLAGSCASGTSGASSDLAMKPASSTTEEDRWAHYNEFIFVRP